MNGISIQYGNIAVGAKESFVPTSSDNEFDTLKQLQINNAPYKRIANPCELYQTVLDGEASAFPSEPNLEYMGFWSKQLSGVDGVFEPPVILELESVGQYSSQGITFTFDKYNEIYPTRLKIKWIRIVENEITVLGEKEFSPDKSYYFCENNVENYNKLIIEFYSLNMPKNRLKLFAIEYGTGVIFYANELRNVQISQQLSPASTELGIGTANFTIDSKTDTEYSFQTKQPLIIRLNDNVVMTSFVKNAKRTSKKMWQAQTEDYVGLMDGVTFYGGIYNGKDAYELLVEIFSVAKVPYEINEDLKGVFLYGYIPITTCRNALKQVLFAVQNVLITSNTDKARVVNLSEEISQTIPKTRIMQGQNFGTAETVTAVQITSHLYTPSDESVLVYDATESGSGENLVVKFSEPLHSLSITNGSFAVDNSGNEIKGDNYAVINANAKCKLSGKKYTHSTTIHTKRNDVVLAIEAEKTTSITEATLVSSHNIKMVLEKSFKWLTNTNSTNLKIVEARHITGNEYVRYGSSKYGTVKYGGKTDKIITYDKAVDLGDKVSCETEYLGNVTGHIIRQSFSLENGTIIKEAVLK